MSSKPTVKELVICPVCKAKFKDDSSQVPKILPCGKVIVNLIFWNMKK